MASSREQIEKEAINAAYWWHSIDLGNGVVTKGDKSPQMLTHELENMHLPDLRGKSVLDVGAWDGFFSFEAERRGARRVVSLDHFIWSLDPTEAALYRQECRRNGTRIGRYEERPKVWRPDILPGKRGYDFAHRALDSKVECKVADFMTATPADLGTFDVVFFMGVLYHMENPLDALKWLASVTDGLAIIETATIAVPGYEDVALAEFYEGDELNTDPTNWWAHNRKSLEGMCRAAGFEHVEIMAWPWDGQPSGTGVQRGRGVVHACKKKPASPYGPRTVKPLPEGDFKARITADISTIVLSREKSTVVPVKVRNDSTQPWTPERKIHLSYHIRDKSGAMLLWAGARSWLPRALRPDEEAVVDCTIPPFDAPPSGIIEFDMVQETVVWFSERGSPTCKVHFTVA